jgi:GT2 family glycosyltransferase
VEAVGVNGGGGPEIAVVVASHDRPLRLRWLLNALEHQTLARDRWEVVVAHDSSGPDTDELLREHPLAAEGVLSHVTFDPGRGSAAKRRNAGWRKSRAPLIAFTDDDCRPPPDWLERALEAASRHPGAIVQGKTAPDPDEGCEFSGAHVQTQAIEPPTPNAQTCNIVYPRKVLEAVGGFTEQPPLDAGGSVEDTDLAVRARKAGAEHVGASEVVTFHTVQAGS